MTPKTVNDTWQLKMGIVAYKARVAKLITREIASDRNRYTKTKGTGFYTEPIEDKETIDICTVALTSEADSSITNDANGSGYNVLRNHCIWWW
jgi:hypothetical protein